MSADPGRVCPSCGHPVEDDFARFCGHCGALLVGLDPPDELTGTALGHADSGPMPAVDAARMSGVEPGRAALVVLRGPAEGTSFPLDGDVVSVGRSPDTGVFLDDITVSRHHAEFRRDADGWSVHDAGSLNGTYVNRQRTDAAPLVSGDEVQIGKYRFVFLTNTEAAG